MSTATIERPIERTSEALSAQAQRAAITSPRPYWPLPAAQVASAHLTWPEWVALLTERIANERHIAQTASATASVSSEEMSPALV